MATKPQSGLTADDIPRGMTNEESKLWATLVVTQREFSVAASKLGVSTCLQTTAP